MPYSWFHYTGRLVSARGKYKAYVVTGTALVALWALPQSPTHHPEHPHPWIFCSYMAVMGAGLSMSMQFLPTLIVQNAFPVTVVGTATAATTSSAKSAQPWVHHSWVVCLPHA